ncbi:hypothetical protein HX045_04020 [Myroides odoratimimus]|uniref:DUF304 domain-containing protein n=1 Tax=Myroides odoratimimus CIP 101113 TaxID=883154 RepID=A0AAV3F5P5_9FLAO|nr:MULTISPECIES: hypothetical protein [Myroides]AJA69151.1 hypothetical protein MYRA21_2017 [Myroides sp. A21]EHO13345.1 hypothetical protein HMPREF9714_00902 [Myroides odoratimimus CCUG 12901]EHO13886.1 hypothetical protein HMPREF9715_00960 [Myroides odoratimimus CIP 101113]MDM1064355.1 hypothetical protein [Myroides odoratimimus]MDM1084668.1 hypothetical protein [Myroides odoratimimus]
MIAQEKRLSYQYSLGHLILNILLTILFCSIATISQDVGDYWFVIIKYVITVLVTCITVSQVIYLCTAYIRGDKLILKKYFRSEKQYTAKQLVNIKKYNLGRIHLIMVSMKSVDGSIERYMIMNIYAWYAQSVYDAEEELSNWSKK